MRLNAGMWGCRGLRKLARENRGRLFDLLVRSSTLFQPHLAAELCGAGPRHKGYRFEWLDPRARKAVSDLLRKEDLCRLP
jgi:hypothetical protein